VKSNLPRPRDLFAAAAEKNAKTPLADRIRPRTLDEFIGQEHILGPGRLLRRAIQADRLSSLIFSGPPGVGKTTLARIIANGTQSQFLAINAVLAGIKEIRDAIEMATEASHLRGQKTILFIDEVHRFNKAQQDALLPHVENGTLTLIGATTENPFFEVNKALVSRSRVFQMRALEDKDIRKALEAALSDAERGYGKLKVVADDDALDHIVRRAQGDARSALNALELAVETTQPDAQGEIRLTLQVAEESIQRKAVLYDKDGDAHYDTISAFIKSVRGSDPDASLYWMAKMVEAGEDPRFIFRRMIILASEDVGLADPNALRMVMSAAQAFDYVGLPEGQFHLSQACLYLATAPKSNSTMAYYEALESVRKERIGEVPDPLRDKSRDAELGHGQGYLYPHAFRDHWVEQQYLPSGLKGRVFYEPGSLGHESGLRDEVLRRREAQWAALEEAPSRAVKASLKSDWLERASGVGSEALRHLRDDLLRAAGLKRESLVLDLGGHHGFLTWEALRRCVEGGVWCRCDNAAEEAELEAWTKRIDPFSKPQLLVSTLVALPEALGREKEVPRFDAILGLGAEPPSEEWFKSMVDAASPSKWVLAFRRGQESIPWSEWLAAAPEALRRRVLDLPREPAPVSTGERVEARLKAAGWQVQRKVRRYTDKRGFSSTQAQEWLGRASEARENGRGGPMAATRAALAPGEWERVAAAVTAYLTEGARDFPAAFDVLVIEP
jgi:putative ATPase